MDKDHHFRDVGRVRCCHWPSAPSSRKDTWLLRPPLAHLLGRDICPHHVRNGHLPASLEPIFWSRRDVPQRVHGQTGSSRTL